MQNSDKINNKLPPVTDRGGINRVVVFNVSQDEDRSCETTVLLSERRREVSPRKTKRTVLFPYYARLYCLFSKAIVVARMFLSVKRFFFPLWYS